MEIIKEEPEVEVIREKDSVIILIEKELEKARKSARLESKEELAKINQRFADLIILIAKFIKDAHEI